MGHKMSSPTGPAGGDLGGSYPNPTVVQTHLNNGSSTAPSLTFSSDTSLGMYHIGSGQMGVTVPTNGKVAEFGNFSVTNIIPSPYGPNSVRYTQSLTAQPLSGNVESTGLYIKMNHSAGQMVYGIYGEIDSSQSLTGGSFTKVNHLGSGDAHYVAQFGSGGCIGYEAASWSNGSTGFLADVQKDGLGNTILFNALWQQPTVPNYGMFVATDSPGNALTISKLSGADDGQVQIRITEPSYSYNRFEAYSSGQVNQKATRSTSSVVTNNAPEHRLVSTYWNGTQNVERHAVIGHEMIDTTPNSAMYFRVGPYAAETTIMMLSPGQVDLQTSQIVTCGGITMKAGGANVDMQTGQMITCGGLTMKAGGANVDLQGGVVVNCNSVQTTSAMTFAANGFTVAQFSYDSVNTTGQVNLNIATTNVASAGTATLPSNPLGFMVVMLNGSFVKVPYYAV